jgi:anti-sigma regulatory factor (Ser/Thr protein kinase)
VTVTPARSHGHLHEAVLFGSDAELRELVVDFTRDAVTAGEAVVVAVPDEVAAVVRRAVGDDPGVQFVSGPGGRPLPTLAGFRARFESLLGAGAPRVRAVGLMAAPGGPAWDPWRRYEAAANRVLADLPLWGRCLYDARVTPEAVVADVCCTHPVLTDAHGTHRANPTYVPPEVYLVTTQDAPDPLESRPPLVEHHDPTSAVAREAVMRLAGAADLPAADTHDLVLAVSEVVTNANRHGVAPVVVRGWAGAGRVVVAVNDRGTGPVDPLAGWVRPIERFGAGGRGLWLAEHLCARVGYRRDVDGFTLTLTAEASAP